MSTTMRNLNEKWHRLMQSTIHSDGRHTAIPIVSIQVHVNWNCFKSLLIIISESHLYILKLSSGNKKLKIYRTQYSKQSKVTHMVTIKINITLRKIKVKTLLDIINNRLQKQKLTLVQNSPCFWQEHKYRNLSQMIEQNMRHKYLIHLNRQKNTLIANQMSN